MSCKHCVQAVFTALGGVPGTEHTQPHQPEPEQHDSEEQHDHDDSHVNGHEEHFVEEHAGCAG